MGRDTVQPVSIRRGLAVLALLLALLAPALAAGPAELAAFARGLGLEDTDGFARTVEALERTGKLPATYVTKAAAERLGWKPGQDLWSVAPGKAIGGDVFANREGRLPAGAGIRYREADLDYRGGKRNAKRLIFGSNGERWVTVDHYQSFRMVPR
jgi:hypothetical protein